MLRVVLLLGVLGGLAWWYFIGGRTMDEADVRAFYAAEAAAVRKMDAEALCDQRSADFAGNERTSISGHSRVQTYDKARYCELQRSNFENVKRMLAMAGKEVAVDLEVEFKSIVVAADRKSATVEYVQRVLVNDLVASKAKVVETLEKRNGTVRSLRTDYNGEVYGKLAPR